MLDGTRWVNKCLLCSSVGVEALVVKEFSFLIVETSYGQVLPIYGSNVVWDIPSVLEFCFFCHQVMWGGWIYQSLPCILYWPHRLLG